MSKTNFWLSNWLIGPSLGQYFIIRPGDPSAEQSDTSFQSTKQLLKEHMVDSFFERALNQIGTPNSGDSHHEAIPDLSIPPHGDKDVHISEVYEHDEPAPLPKYDLSKAQDEDEAIATRSGYFEDEDAFSDEEFVAQQLAEVIEINDLTQPEPEVQAADTGYYLFAMTLNQYDYELPTEELLSGYPLFLFGHGKIQAVLSEIPLSEYGEQALQSRLNDPTWFESTLKKHNNILSHLQSVVSIVPMRMCTICDSTESLTSFLKEHHDDFVNTLELIEGNQSWRFNISCNHRKLRLLTEKASNRVRAIQAETSGKTSLEAEELLFKLEQVLEEEARSVCKACIKHSHGTLSSYASKKLIHSQTHQQETEDGMQLIFRCEYLVPNQAKELFLNEMLSLKESYKSLGFELHMEGPLPPSQFTERNVLPAKGTGSTIREKAQITRMR